MIKRVRVLWLELSGVYKMIKIAFLGCDSTHTEAFGNRINGENSIYKNIVTVTSIWGVDGKQAAEKADKLRIPKCAKTIEEAIEGVDLAMVIGRFGDSHYMPAEMAIKKGIATFVDKPFTTDLKEAKALADLAKKNNVKMCSSSPLRFANEIVNAKEVAKTSQLVSVTVSAPAHCIDLQGDKRFESTFFYGIHGIEMLLELMGEKVDNVEMQNDGNTINVLMKFGKRTATLNLIRNADEFYSFSAIFKDKILSASVNLDGSYYSGMLDFILNRFYPGKETIPLQSTVDAISTLEFIENKFYQKGNSI